MTQQPDEQQPAENGVVSDAPNARKRRPTQRRQSTKRGLVLVNTGDGKGKTTAAFGVILRMLGRKKRVALIQFLKSEGGQWGEIRALAQLGLDAIKTGDGWTWTSKDLDECESAAWLGACPGENHQQQL